jgi:hypothetical protein
MRWRSPKLSKYCQSVFIPLNDILNKPENTSQQSFATPMAIGHEYDLSEITEKWQVRKTQATVYNTRTYSKS